LYDATVAAFVVATHTLLHVPQLLTSLCRLTLQLLALQPENGETHEPTVQEPPLQVSPAECGIAVVQTVPQEPQLLVSVFLLMLQPDVAGAPQLMKPAEQVLITQTPDGQLQVATLTPDGQTPALFAVAAVQQGTVDSQPLR